MATRSFVPRQAGEGSLGTVSKPWGAINVRDFTTLLRNTEYAEGEIVFHSDLLKRAMYLKCRTGGITGNYIITLNTAEEGDILKDGTAEWLVVPLSSDVVELVQKVNEDLYAEMIYEDGVIKVKNLNGDEIANIEIDKVSSSDKATSDGSGNNIQDSYASSMSSLNDTIALKNNKGDVLSTVVVDGVANAMVSAKATQDGSGNVITTNYASSISYTNKTLSLKSKSGGTLSTVTLEIEDLEERLDTHNRDENAHDNLKIFCPNIQRNTAYSLGDIAYSKQLPSYMYLECIQAGTTADTEPSFGGGYN